MLSRVAQNIYWMARYTERAEDTARLINVNTNLLLDLPRNTPFGWEPLLLIMSSKEQFLEKYQTPDEVNIIKFLVGERDNPGSILSCLSFARENLRTTRDVVPREAWEQINDLYMYVRDRLEMGMWRGRYEFLKRVIQGVQQITGLLAGTMSHTQDYDFVRLGRNLERADMTTRILDVRSANLLSYQLQSQSQSSEQQNQSQGQDQVELDPFDNIQWMSVLKSLSGYQMYRRQVRLRVRGPDVVRFLLQDVYFPRAVCHCLKEIEKCLGRLPRNEAVLENVSQLQQNLITIRISELPHGSLHEFLDKLQIDLAAIHEQIEGTYFAR